MVKSEAWPVNGFSPIDAAKMIAGEALFGELETSDQLLKAVRPRSRRRVRSWGLDSNRRWSPATDPKLEDLKLRYNNARARIQQEFQQALITGRVLAVGVLNGMECRKLIPPEMFIGRSVSLWFTATEATRWDGASWRPLYRAVRVFNGLRTAEAYAENVATTVGPLKSYGPKTADYVAAFFQSDVALQEEIASGASSNRGWKSNAVRKIQLEYKTKYGKTLDTRGVGRAVGSWVDSYNAAKHRPGKQHLKIAK